MSIEPSEKSSITEIAVQQLNLSYSSEQDRLLLKVGLSDQTEILLWLTQRIARMIWQLLGTESHLPSVSGQQSLQSNVPPQQAVQQFKQEVEAVQTLQKLDFSTAYQPRKEALHPGGMLIKEVHLVTVHATGQQALEMQSVDGFNMRLNLTQETILAICNMLQLSVKEAAWQLNIVPAQPTNPSTILQPDKNQKLH